VLRDTEQQLASLQTTHGMAKNAESELRSTISRQEAELHHLNEKVERLSRLNADLEKEQSALRHDDTTRRRDHEKSVATLDGIQKRVLDERKAELDERERMKSVRLQEMRERWSRHEKDVESTLRTICRKHTIEYIEVVPFKGNPDNTVRIGGEFVVFDAKSPGGDDLRNFPTYIRSQTEAVRKYVNQEGVRREVFLVIPPDTAEILAQVSYNLAEYSVFIITPNALEPILLSLKRLEDYEFVNQLSPEERENICRLIGKFAHVLKRRIQVDHFFAWEFLEVLTRCESDLPKEFLDRIIEFEKSEKLNPPLERRSKQILTRDLEEDTRKLQRETAARMVEIPPPLSDASSGLPLFERQEG
jgi:hypothetical protein